MKGFIGEYIEQLHIEKLRHRKVSAWTSMLALLVVFTVVWGLRVKGISLTNDTDCGIEEHMHDEECYQVYQICGLNEGDKDYHEEVSEEDGELIITEILHAHTDACYEREFICTLPEHVHTVACLDVEEEKTVEVADADEITDDSGIISPDETVLNDETDGELDDEMESEETDELEEEEELEEELNDGISLLAIDIQPDSPKAMIERAYEEHLAEMEKEEGERDQSKIIKFGEFYVVTATGLRHKDRINENLDGTYNPNNEDNRYVLYRGAPLTLVVFRNSSQSGNYIFVRDDSNGRVIGHDGSTDGYNGVDDELPNNITAVYAQVSGGNEYNHATFGFDRGNGSYDNFYTYVRGNQTYYHSDIEIADGGFFKIQTTRNFENGGYQVVKTRYDSYVSDVYKCNIYFDEDENSKLLFPGTGVPRRDGVGLDFTDPDNQYCGPDKTVYQENNSSGSTQYELTSAWNCNGNEAYGYNIADIDHVVFSVEISLAPMTSEVIRYDSNHQQVGEPEYINFAKKDGTYDYTVTPLEVSLGKQSIVDAMNKCPVHNGMDFNLLYREINLDLVQPTNADFMITKYLDADNPLGHNVGEFAFELLDSDGNVISIIHPDSGTGEVQFPIQDYPIPGQYKYRIREVIPENAVEIEPGVYYKDLVVYDGRVLDVVVDVYLSQEILAIVESETTAGYTELMADVHFYINGEEIDRSADEPVEYHNAIGNYSVKNLIVEKQWVGSGTHDNNITFRILRSRNGEESQYYSVDEKTVFELNDSNNWRMEFRGLPVIIGTDAYSYDVVETSMLGYSPSYVREDYDDRIVYTIKNISNEDKYLHFKKIWTDEEGNTYVPPEGTTKVSLKLMREYKDVDVPVNVKIQPVGGGDKFSNGFVLSGYNGGSVEFKLETRRGEYYRLDLASNTNCDFARDGDKYIISNIKPGAEIVLTYPDVTAGELIYWSTDGNSFDHTSSGYGKWSNNGGYLNNCYSSYWSNNGGGTYSALSLLGRRADWNYAFLSIDPAKCIPGERYSFNAYIMFRNECREEGQDPGQGRAVNESPSQLKIQLYYQLPNSDTIWDDIAVIDNPVAGNWYPVQNVGFRIPEGARNLQIQVNTTERNRNSENYNDYYVDLYFDDVIIAPYMYKPGVEENSGRLTTTRTFWNVDERRTVPASALDWTPEGQVKAFTIEKDNNWEKSFKISDLGVNIDGIAEEPGRSYRYYVIENPTIQNYKPIYLNDYVAYNDATTPITVENQYRAYVLPNTGGIGANRIRWLGLLILLAGIPPVLVNLVRKRGRPSG